MGRRFCAFVIPLVFVSCVPEEPASDGSGTWVGTITTVGNVTTVVNESGSLWGGTATLVEEASIGIERGEDEYMLGRVSGMAATDERIYVVDAQVPAIRIYDWDGDFIENLGGMGSGPGEYRSPQAVGVDHDGRIYVYDADGNRLVTYSATGQPIATVGLPCCRVRYEDLMTVTEAGEVYLRGDYPAGGAAADESPFEARARGHMLIQPDGSGGDVLEIPRFEASSVLLRAVGARLVREFVAPFHPGPVHVFAPTPAVVAGFSSVYRFEVRHLDGRVTVIERRWNPVPLTPEEAAAYRDGVTTHMRTFDPAWQWGEVGVAPTKPAFNAFVPAMSGELWVVRDGPGYRVEGCDEEVAEPTREDMAPCWQQQRIFDVFGADGHFLGEVAVPDQMRISPRPFIRGSNLIVVVEDQAGTIMVKRYRMVLPGEESR